VGRVLQLDAKHKVQEDSPLTLEMKEFIDRVIVPILVKQYLAEAERSGGLVHDSVGVAESSRGVLSKGARQP